MSWFKRSAFIRQLVSSSSVLVGLLTGSTSQAILFCNSGDPGYNTTSPSGTLAGSGWQFQGLWAGFLGTPIASHYFITAAHVGGQAGDVFSFRGIDYVTTAHFDDPQSDLRIWQVCGTFPEYAQLYSRQDEAGQGMVAFGRGGARGPAVYAPGNGALKGWQWGTYDGRLRWGQNQINGIVNGMLKASFDLSGGANECHFSIGDSGGGVFLKDGTVWKLAGINYGADGQYNTSSQGTGFYAALFDQGGMYIMNGASWQFQPDQAADLPGAIFATRISERILWINSIVSQPATGCGGGPNDFNGDGLTDVIFQDSTGYIGYWSMAGAVRQAAGFFTPNVVSPLWRLAGSGDFNGDGHTDLVFQYTDGTVGIWWMAGTQMSSASLLNPAGPGSGWRVVGTGDFDGDGKPDILFQDSSGALAVWLMDGVNLKSSQYLTPMAPSAPGWQAVGVGDFNRDGKPDILFQHLDGTLCAWLMNGTTLAAGSMLQPSTPGDSNWRVRTVIDLNGDGACDLVFQYGTGGSLAAWFMQGTTLSSASFFTPSVPGGTWNVAAP